MLDEKAWVFDPVLASHAFEIALPALTIGWIRKHEVELARRERIVRERGMFGTTDDVVRRVTFAFEQQVGLTDRVGLGVDLLSVEMCGHLLAVFRGELLEGFFGDGQHAARSTGAVVEQVRAGFNLVRDGKEDQLRHQPDGIARRPVLAGFLIVLLVETAYQLFEDRPHTVIVETRMLHRAVRVLHGIRAEIDVRRKKFLDQRPERVCLR